MTCRLYSTIHFRNHTSYIRLNSRYCPLWGESGTSHAKNLAASRTTFECGNPLTLELRHWHSAEYPTNVTLSGMSGSYLVVNGVNVKFFSFQHHRQLETITVNA